MKKLNVAIDLNKGITGVIEDMNVLNFADGIFALNKFYGVSMKALSDHTGINYNTMRVICALEEKVICDEKCVEAIERLTAVYLGK